MSTIAELLPFLEQGATLRSSRGESLRTLPGGRIEYVRARGYRFEPEVVSLAEVRNIHDVWDWRVIGGVPQQEERA